MRTAKVPLHILVTLILLSMIALSGCMGHKSLGERLEERHQKDMQLRQQEIERRQLELDCLKRKQADPAVDCSQFHEFRSPAR